MKMRSPVLSVLVLTLAGLAKELFTGHVRAAAAMMRTTKLEQRLKAQFDQTKSHFPLNHSSRPSSLIAVTMLVLLTATMRPGSRSVIADEPAKGKQDDLVSVSGRVVGPSGQAIEGAKLYVVVQERADLRAVANQNGEFEFQMQRQEFRIENTYAWSIARIVAVAEGYGIDFQAACSFESTGLLVANTLGGYPAGNSWDRTLRLVPDDVPIVGTITDSSGKPVSNATVSVTGEIWLPEKQDLAPIEMAIERGEDYDVIREMMERVTTLAPVPEMREVTSDSDGAFRLLCGIGRERIVRLKIAAPGIATEIVYVRTRPGRTYQVPHVLEDPSNGMFRFFGSTFEYVARTGQTIEGTVRDQKTQQPLSGVVIRFFPKFSDQLASQESDRENLATTDEQGRYRLTGALPGKDHDLFALPVQKPYLAATKQTTTSSTSGTEIDFELTKGVPITGRVIDAETGKPAAQARLTYFLPRDNSFFGTVKNYGGSTSIPWWELCRTNDRGEYTLIGLPGRGFVAAIAADDERHPRGATTAETKAKYANWDELTITAVPRPMWPGNYNYVSEIDISPHAQNYSLEIPLSKGPHVGGNVTDQEGRPLAGSNVGGMAKHAGPELVLPSSHFTIYGFDPGDPQQVYFLHKKRHLAGQVLLKGPQPSPIQVQLEPWGSISGRIVDANGKPQANALIQGRAPGRRNRPGRAVFLERHYLADDQGAFKIDGLVPGLKYEVDILDQGKKRRTSAMDVTVKAGETLQLGDVTVQAK